MLLVQIPECCSLTMVRHLDTVDLGQWATSCRSTSDNSTESIQRRHTVLPSLLVLYVTAYLQPQAVARLAATGLPWTYLLQDLMIPAGDESLHQERQNRVACRRPPMLLRPMRLRPFFSTPHPSWGTIKWRSVMRVHVSGYHGGLEGLLSQWYKIPHLLDMAHRSHRLHTLLSADVTLPGARLSKYRWETELLRRLRDHNRFLSSLGHRRRTMTSSTSSDSSD
jgi:hypothetical protein